MNRAVSDPGYEELEVRVMIINRPIRFLNFITEANQLKLFYSSAKQARFPEPLPIENPSFQFLPRLDSTCSSSI